MSLALSGIGVSRGIAIGRAHVLLRGSIEVLESVLPEDLIENEVERFLQAVHSARLQLESLREQVDKLARPQPPAPAP